MPYTSHMNIRAHLGDIWLINAHPTRGYSEGLVKIVAISSAFTGCAITLEYINISTINPLSDPPEARPLTLTCFGDWLEHNGIPLPDNRMTRILYG